MLEISPNVDLLNTASNTKRAAGTLDWFSKCTRKKHFSDTAAVQTLKTRKRSILNR